MKFEIIDNFLEKNIFDELKTILLNKNFPWYYQPEISYPGDKNTSFYFVHTFFEFHRIYSDVFTKIIPVLEKIKIKSLIRVKANLYTNQNTKIIHSSHKDYDYEHKGAILYINNNNGHTILEGKEKIESIENRLLLFEPHKEHNSTNCTNEKTRINININYF
jgi:hypothetical protein